MTAIELTDQEKAIEIRKQRSLRLARNSYRVRHPIAVDHKANGARVKTAAMLPASGTIWRHRITGERRMVANEVTGSGRELFGFILPYQRGAPELGQPVYKMLRWLKNADLVAP